MSRYCECEICNNNLPFEIPKEIIESLLTQNLVLFAGAGISTENKSIFKETLFEEVFLELNIDDPNVSFPDLMSSFCSSSANGRQKLLEKIKKRFDYIHQFKELYTESSSFHHEISKFWMLQNIITTNWDDHFERECNAIPIITPEDFVFYNMNQRKVFKIHGSISNYGSIVATKEDYEQCYKNLSTGLVGANLKTLLATKTILFVGYSFRDFDFNKVISLLKIEMGNVFPHLYIISLDENIPDFFAEIKFTHIKTTGKYFFEKIRQHLTFKNIILPDEFIIRFIELKYLLTKAQRKLHDFYFENPRTCSIIFSSVYLDGVSHAIDYLDFKTKSGETYNPRHIIDQLEIYEKDIKKDLIKARNYLDLAYVNGYMNGLSSILFPGDLEDFPMFFIYGLGSTNDSEIAYDTFKNDFIRHKASEKYGRQFLKEYLNSEYGFILRHRPFIF